MKLLIFRFIKFSTQTLDFKNFRKIAEINFLSFAS